MDEINSFVFYKEYKKAIDTLKTKNKKLQFYELITGYVFYNKIPENTDKELLAMFKAIEKKLDNRNKSYWNYEARRSIEYKKWKKAVLKRDSNKCRICGQTKNLVAHHIVPFSEDTSLRYSVDNGMTLCQNCHREVHKK